MIFTFFSINTKNQPYDMINKIIFLSFNEIFDATESQEVKIIRLRNWNTRANGLSKSTSRFVSLFMPQNLVVYWIHLYDSCTVDTFVSKLRVLLQHRCLRLSSLLSYRTNRNPSSSSFPSLPSINLQDFLKKQRNLYKCSKNLTLSVRTRAIQLQI